MHSSIDHAALEWVGTFAAFCTTVSFVPQLVRVWQRRSARDISLSMFLLFSLGVFCWLVYGIGIGSRPVIAANAVTLVLALAILVLKLWFDHEPESAGRRAERLGSLNKLQ